MTRLKAAARETSGIGAGLFGAFFRSLVGDGTHTCLIDVS